MIKLCCCYIKCPDVHLLPISTSQHPNDIGSIYIIYKETMNTTSSSFHTFHAQARPLIIHRNAMTQTGFSEKVLFLQDVRWWWPKWLTPKSSKIKHWNAKTQPIFVVLFGTQVFSYTQMSWKTCFKVSALVGWLLPSLHDRGFQAKA